MFDVKANALLSLISIEVGWWGNENHSLNSPISVFRTRKCCSYLNTLIPGSQNVNEAEWELLFTTDVSYAAHEREHPSRQVNNEILSFPRPLALEKGQVVGLLISMTGGKFRLQHGVEGYAAQDENICVTSGQEMQVRPPHKVLASSKSEICGQIVYSADIPAAEADAHEIELMAKQHSGEWRDSRDGKISTYCARSADNLKGGTTKICTHEEKLEQQSHWSCCGHFHRSLQVCTAATTSLPLVISKQSAFAQRAHRLAELAVEYPVNTYSTAQSTFNTASILTDSCSDKAALSSVHHSSGPGSSIAISTTQSQSFTQNMVSGMSTLKPSADQADVFVFSGPSFSPGKGGSPLKLVPATAMFYPPVANLEAQCVDLIQKAQAEVPFYTKDEQNLICNLKGDPLVSVSGAPESSKFSVAAFKVTNQEYFPQECLRERLTSARELLEKTVKLAHDAKLKLKGSACQL